MPVTPFHFGPGLFVKSLLRNRFSIFIFVFTQIIIDIEPLYFLTTRQYPVHRFAHTYFGVTLVALFCSLIGRPIRQAAIKIWKGRIASGSSLQSLRINELITYPIALATSLIGGYSHVLLDSVMHADIRPLNPLSEDNILFRSLSLEVLHLLCAALGLLGIVAIVIAEFAAKRKK